MENLIELRNGWWWPKYDIACFKFLSKRQNVPIDISKFCKKTEVVIQAGGNAGMYVNFYEKIFSNVYTFEPDPINFYCLTKNTGTNVIKFQGCLGDSTKFVDLTFQEQLNAKRPNSGGLSVNGVGNIPTFTIDSFDFPVCDLIHLDIEGYEKFALLGGLSTIKRCSPVIALELNGLSSKYNHTDSDVIKIIQGLGYKQVGEISDDFVFIRD
jgi:FkbM family methyltransferase